MTLKVRYAFARALALTLIGFDVAGILVIARLILWR